VPVCDKRHAHEVPFPHEDVLSSQFGADQDLTVTLLPRDEVEDGERRGELALEKQGCRKDVPMYASIVLACTE
jgi:hypothetical protein